MSNCQKYRRRTKPESQYCGFCENNGAPPEIFMNHKLKTVSGLVNCEYLKRLSCPICGATGQLAHTKLYCPQYDWKKH